MAISYRWRRRLVRLRRLGRGFLNRNSGDWFWLRTKRVPVASLNRDLWRWAEPLLSYYVLLILSVIIATLGLLANSSATIIGAMIIAPLMGPITAIAFAMAMNNRRLLKRSALTLLSGAGLSIVTAALIAWSLGLDSLTPEIQARLRPTLIDLGVALAAGAAGAFAKARRHIADALPGVAIAVALVPPLSIIGVGIAMQSKVVTQGATLLFITNLAGIVFSGALVFIWQGYGSAERAQRGLTLSVMVLVLLGIPLGLSFRDLVLQRQTGASLKAKIRTEANRLGELTITDLTVKRQGQGVEVDIKIEAPLQSITEDQVQLMQQLIEEDLHRPVQITMVITPVQRFTISPSQSP